MSDNRCPHCLGSLRRYPGVDGDALITYVNGVAFHSGHCEAMALQQKKARITGTVMPDDIQKHYGGSRR